MHITVYREGDHHVADWGQGPRRCAVGRGGVAKKMREGDGITPIGTWPLRHVYYRADRVAVPRCALPLSALAPDDGWCESPDDPDYNRMVKLPHRSSSESMWRTDPLYDIVLVVGYNDAPVFPGLGSAIFLHLARAGFSPTAGCVAMTLPDVLAALAQLAADDRLIVRG